VSAFGSRYRAFDRFQQRHRFIGFPLAVLQKYADDQGGYHAATITYYGFFAIFPLLLVLTTVLGFVLQSHPHLEQRIINSALGQFPVIGPQLNHGSLHGSTLALVLGLAAALWAGMGVFLASQNAMNHLWGVPFKRRPDPLHARGRAAVQRAVAELRPDHRELAQRGVDDPLLEVRVILEDEAEHRREDEQQECAPARVQGVGPAFEGDAPEVVHRVLGSEEDPHSGPERGGEPEDERERAAVQGTMAELRADHWELAERGVDDPLLEVRVTLENETEHRRQDEQQREDREEAVVGDRRGVVAALIVGVLLQHRKRETQPTMPLLEAIKGAVPAAEGAQEP
jgi:hypothetical protein